MSGGGAEGEEDTESKAGSGLWAVSPKPATGLEPANYEIVTWAEIGRLTHWATQAPQKYLFLNELIKQNLDIAEPGRGREGIFVTERTPFEQALLCPVTSQDCVYRGLFKGDLWLFICKIRRKLEIHMTPNTIYCGFYNACEDIKCFERLQGTPWTDAITGVKRSAGLTV